MWVRLLRNSPSSAPPRAGDGRTEIQDPPDASCRIRGALHLASRSFRGQPKRRPQGRGGDREAWGPWHVPQAMCRPGGHAAAVHIAARRPDGHRFGLRWHRSIKARRPNRFPPAHQAKPLPRPVRHRFGSPSTRRLAPHQTRRSARRSTFCGSDVARGRLPPCPAFRRRRRTRVKFRRHPRDPGGPGGDPPGPREEPSSLRQFAFVSLPYVAPLRSVVGSIFGFPEPTAHILQPTTHIRAAVSPVIRLAHRASGCD